MLKILSGVEIRQKKAAKYAKGRVLDIGFASIPNPFLRGDVTGFDRIHPEVSCKNYKKIIRDNFDNVNKHLTPNTFDTIMALEFIEHIENPIDFFKKCNKLLKKEGFLIISTPTPYYYKTIFGNVFLLKGHSSTKGHISIFIPRIMNNLARDSGFKLIEITPANRVYIPFFTYQLIYVYKKIR